MKKNMLFLLVVLVVTPMMFLLASCENRIIPEIQADDVAVEFDGKSHGITAKLSVAGGLTYEYIGIDNSYRSSIGPIQPGDYKVKISYTPDSLSKIKSACKEVNLRIILPYTVSADISEISAYSGVLKDIVIPTEYKGKSITSIAVGTFAGKTIETVKFPVTSFNVNPVAFSGCESIKTFYISANTVLLDGTYPNDIDIVFYDSPAIIKDDQFGVAIGIDKLEIPQSVIVLEQSSLSRICANTLVLPSHLPLNTVNLSEEIKQVTVYNGGKSENRLPDDFFKNCSNVEKIEIQQGLLSFGNRIFENCTALDELTIYSSIQSVGESLFSNCNLRKLEFDLSFSLQNIELPITLKDIVISDGVTQVPDSSFYECEYVERILLPETIEHIGSYAFYGCKRLTSITLPQQLTVVEYYTFAKCTFLSEIVLPEMISEIKDGAFSDCISLTSIALPIGLTQISPNLFVGCKSLQSVNIPNGVQSIGSSAFGQCSQLKEVVLPNSLVNIGYCAFEFCVNLEELTIPLNVNQIGEHVFLRCDSLMVLTILSETMPIINGNIFSDLPVGCSISVRQNLLPLYNLDYPEVNFVGII